MRTIHLSMTSTFQCEYCSGGSRPSDKGGARSSRSWHKGRGDSSQQTMPNKKICSAFRASLWSKIRALRPGPRAPPLDSPLYCQCFTFKRCDKFKLKCTSHGGMYSAHYFGKISITSKQMIEKNAWRWGLFQCIRQDLEQSPAIITVTAKC